jgi:3-hydroxyacyl-[acyl-carrier-protein] dehydratase
VTSPCNRTLPVLQQNVVSPIELGLPHREPFIFIDSVTRLERGISAEATKSFSGTEPFFSGHFPGNPIVPGVILAEAMAQTAGIAVGGPSSHFFLTAIRSMKFLTSIQPGQEIRFRAEKFGEMGSLIQCNVNAYVGDQLVAEGQIILTAGSARP